MGYDSQRMEITARVSRHNSERDEEDDKLWDELEAEVLAIVHQAKYHQISPEVY